MDFAVAHLSSSCTAVVATRWAVLVAEYVRARACEWAQGLLECGRDLAASAGVAR